MKLKALIIILSIAFLTGCGGGSDAPVAEVETNTEVTYNAAASAGELLEYTLDVDNLSYTYRITESQLGLTNELKSGTLIKNDDGTYTPSTAPNSRVVILPNKMVVGATTLSVNGSNKVTLIAGVPQVTQTVTFSDISGTYNYIGLQCVDSPTCDTTNAVYGTFNIQNDGSWTECTSSDYTANPTGCANKDTGALNVLEDGKFQIISTGGLDFGTGMYYTQPSGKNIMVIDLKDTNQAGYGRGMLVGVPQNPVIIDGSADGVYHYNTSDGDYGALAVVGNKVVSDSLSIVTDNSPWTGFVTPTDSDTKVLISDEGIMFFIMYKDWDRPEDVIAVAVKTD